MNKNFSDLRIASLVSPKPSSKKLPTMLLGLFIKAIGPLLDRLLGINKMRQLYLNNHLQGLEKQEFSQKLIKALGVKILGGGSVLNKIPKKGRCVVVCNHPYGMVEGVIIAQLLTSHRSDTKIMANLGLQVFKEIKDYFIFANPLKPNAAINSSAIKKCFKHVKDEGLLVIFPAGKVSTYQPEKQRITDDAWNRLSVQIAVKTEAPVLPIFISGSNSALFHRMGRIYFRLRLLMLVREMLKLNGRTISLHANNLISAKQLNKFTSIDNMNDFVRAQCYLNDPDYFTPWLEDNTPQTFKDILPMSDQEKMTQELAQLPDKQHLLDFKSFSVYYGYQSQLPTCVREITRLREITFRTLNEGSGEVCDTDKFDATYMHLFIFDHENKEIIGAYRIGQTDKLLEQGDTSQLYLSQMFDFQPEFINQQQPCLEMGRSFIVEAHQSSFHGLLLLWKGIGAFVSKHPKYRTLYGTVSLSKLYDPRSVALINHIMLTDSIGVNAQTPFNAQLNPDLADYLNSNSFDINQLSSMVMAIEEDGKDLPILLKQYHKLNAKFHCIGIDSNFNHTPGLLLSVDLPNAPDKLLNLYLGKGKEDYVNYDNK